ncbi:Uncharacterised protein [uncultured archaeon]|nr:Uncharacterised protein [uncultured archaeon]
MDPNALLGVLGFFYDHWPTLLVLLCVATIAGYLIGKRKNGTFTGRWI